MASDPPAVTAAPTASPSAEAPTAEPPMPTPPAASIAVEGGDPVVGDLGSFTWQNGGSDSPWLPGNPIRVGAGERLTLVLEQPVAIETWTVSRTPAASFGQDEVGLAEGTRDPVSFPAPPLGSWSVSVSVWFAGGIGSAVYYWLIDVS